MHINLGPWSRLLRALSIPGLLALGSALVGAVALCYFYVHGTTLRLLGPLIGLAGGVGISAWLFALGRLFWSGGKVVRIFGVALAVAVVAGGGLTWYSLSVVQPNARGACYGAAHSSLTEMAAEELIEGKALLESWSYRLADRLRPDPSIAADCAAAQTTRK